MALVIRSRNDIVYTHGLSDAVAPSKPIDWAKYDPPYFDSFAWRNRKPIVLGAGLGVLVLLAAAAGAVLK